MANSLRNHFANYLENMQMLNLSPNTIAHRKTHGNEFLDWCEMRDLTEPDQITRKLVEAFQRHIHRKRRKDGEPYSIRSQLLRLDAVRGFCRFLAKTDVMEFNPTDRMEMPKKPDTLPKAILSEDEVQQVLAIPDTTTVIGIRDRAMLEVLWATGIRREELTNLGIYSIDFVQQTLMVRHGKGGRDRVAPIGRKALVWVQAYLDNSRPVLLKDIQEQTLFLSLKGKKLRKETLSCYVGSYVRKADTGKTGSCHLIRHSVGTLLMRNGLNIRLIQQFLGHRKLETTQIYTHLTIVDLKEAYLKAHPSARLDEPNEEPEP